MIYNYISEMKETIYQAIVENDCYKKQIGESTNNYKERLYDEMFSDDSITGNMSGSYFCDTYKASECLVGNLFILKDALIDYGISDKAIDYIDNPEKCDVVIRCYLLSQAIDETIAEMPEEEYSLEYVYIDSIDYKQIYSDVLANNSSRVNSNKINSSIEKEIMSKISSSVEKYKLDNPDAKKINIVELQDEINNFVEELHQFLVEASSAISFNY